MASAAYSATNGAPISLSGCFINRVNRFAPRGFGLASNHVSKLLLRGKRLRLTRSHRFILTLCSTCTYCDR
jgi:hypothetical protein